MLRSLRSPRRVALVVVAAITLAAFSLSFVAIVQTAHEAHVTGWRAPLVPLLIDGATIAALLVIVARALEDLPAAGPWSIVAAASAASVAANVYQAPRTPVAALVAALPPIALAASAKMLASEYRKEALRRQRADLEPAARARLYWQEAERIGGRRLSARELADAIGIPRETARDHLRRLRADAPPLTPAPIDNHEPPAPVAAALEREGGS
jgi:Protein of unknown function (DUF2637)